MPRPVVEKDRRAMFLQLEDRRGFVVPAIWSAETPPVYGDGFHCLVCTHAGRLRARSRNGGDMSGLLPELAASVPPDGQLDGELVAWDSDGHPDFHRLGRRMLHGDTTLAVTLMVFDVLAIEGLPVTAEP
jgi:ATP-dependent DNA ligase